ncbi:MAG: Ser-Thr-rich GPI-anchored membrane family protein, partial [Candidatus Marinimicrobia bacterium]|nr:Ser-Thr-rich GPI-anchored membrane family protein [Candidatus Neomarinimicrobiota bacterium]
MKTTMQPGKEKTSNKKILTLATVLLVVLLQPAVATVTVTGTLSSNESASGAVYAGIVDMNANPIDWSNTVESSWVGNFTFPANFTSFQVEFFNVNVGYEYYLIVFVDQDSNGYPDAYEIGAIHGPFYLSSNNFNVGDIPLFTGGATGGGGGTGGMIEGTVGSGESTYGTAIVGLFDIPDPSNWSDRIAERNLGSQSFPNYGIWFDFQEDFIFDSEYVVAAFIDENGDQQPDAMEAIGMASVTVTGGYGNTGDINMSYGGGGGGGPTYIEVTSPDYMSNWSAGTGESIEWNSTSDGDYAVEIELLKGGNYYEWIASDWSNSNGDNYWWSIPPSLEGGSDYQIKVSHILSGVAGFSDNFQISGGGGGGGPSYIDVTSPNSMSNWTAGTGESIDWNSSTSDGSNYAVDIELWKEAAFYELIESGNPSESWGGSYWWSIPAYLEDGNDYEIRVLHVDSGVDDYSDNFQISGGGGGGPTYIQVTSPVSGSVWYAGTEESISWSSDGSDYEVDIELWRDGNYYQWIVWQYPSGGSEDYQWYIPNLPEGSNYQIRISTVPYSMESFSDYFQIIGGGEGGFVSGNIHSDESVSGELIFGLFSPSNGGADWDPDWWNNQYVTFPTDEFYFFDESGISDGYGYEVWAFVDANSNYSPDPEELQGKSGAFEVLDGFATNIDFDLNFGYGTAGYSVEFDANTVVETDFSAYDGGPGFTFELFFKPFYVPESGETFELFRREDWGILQYDGTQQKFIFGLYGIGQTEYTQSLVTDEWYHIAAEYDDSKLRLYVNGNYSEYNSPGGSLPNTPSDDTFIGENLEGLIDIVRMS